MLIITLGCWAVTDDVPDTSHGANTSQSLTPHKDRTGILFTEMEIPGSKEAETWVLPTSPEEKWARNFCAKSNSQLQLSILSTRWLAHSTWGAPPFASSELRSILRSCFQALVPLGLYFRKYCSQAAMPSQLSLFSSGTGWQRAVNSTTIEENKNVMVIGCSQLPETVQRVDRVRTHWYSWHNHFQASQNKG